MDNEIQQSFDIDIVVTQPIWNGFVKNGFKQANYHENKANEQLLEHPNWNSWISFIYLGIFDFPDFPDYGSKSEHVHWNRINAEFYDELRIGVTHLFIMFF